MDPESYREECDSIRSDREELLSEFSTYQCEHKRANVQGKPGDQCPNDAEYEIEEDRFCALCIPLAIRAASKRSTVRRPVIVRYIGK